MQRLLTLLIPIAAMLLASTLAQFVAANPLWLLPALCVLGIAAAEGEDHWRAA